MLIDLPLTWVALLMAGIGIIIIIGFSQQKRIEAWAHAYVSRRADRNVSADGAIDSDRKQ